jgi:hypothetical protein
VKKARKNKRGNGVKNLIGSKAIPDRTFGKTT